ARWDYQFQAQTSKPLSLLKVAALLPLYLPAILWPELQPQLEDALLKQIRYHCTYEKRADRMNYVEMLKLT
ncbi:MAG TPA: hypothetical protein VFA74_12455, partial [Terriglobales bacterium]|nr:hypothetical protein [Terriglobales bacterium]